MPLARLIPCLDVAHGRVVKGVNFVGLRDVGDPVELAKFYSDGGADELVFLDITATPEDSATMTSVVAASPRSSSVLRSCARLLSAFLIAASDDGPLMPGVSVLRLSP